MNERIGNELEDLVQQKRNMTILLIDLEKFIMWVYYAISVRMILYYQVWTWVF